MVGWGDLRRGLIAAAVLLPVACVLPASALAADSPLDLAQKALKSGKPELALRALNAALSGNLLKGNDIAKAFYLRGLAFAKSGNQAAAIADLNNALYLKGLSDADRQAAMAAKSAAFQKAGVPMKSDAGSAPAAAPVTAEAPPPNAKPKKMKELASVPDGAAASEQTASAEALPWQAATLPPAASKPVPAVQTAAVTPAADPTPNRPVSASENPVNSFLGGLFSFGQPAPAKPAAAAEAQAFAPTVTVTPAASGTAASNWKTAGLTKAASSPVVVAPSAKAGGIYLQVASLRTTGEAQTVADKLTSDHAATLAGIQPSIAPTVLGNMGTFYAVRLGPVANKAAGTVLCARLRKEGVDCFFATP
jgi:hypothetical protein